MPEAIITYFGQQAKVCCDGNCQKAWGLNSRSRKQLTKNEDDFVFLLDSELGEAPIDPGTYEGGHAKPKSVKYFPTKWCVRECERCNISNPSESKIL